MLGLGTPDGAELMSNFIFKHRGHGVVKSVKAATFKEALKKYHFNKGWDHIGTDKV